MKVLLVQNITREGPGLIANILHARNVPFDLIDLHKGDLFPDPALYNALIVFGGPQSANDTNDRMLAEIANVKKAADAHIPFLGICLGMQVLVKAQGGTVLPAETPEIGWRDYENNFFEIELTVAGNEDKLFANISSPVKIFQLHGETVLPKENMKLLATGKWCENQVVKFGENANGIQGHFELTPEMFERWVNEDDDLQEMDTEKLRADYDVVRVEYETTGRQLITNFLQIAKLI